MNFYQNTHLSTFVYLEMFNVGQYGQILDPLNHIPLGIQKLLEKNKENWPYNDVRVVRPDLAGNHSDTEIKQWTFFFFFVKYNWIKVFAQLSSYKLISSDKRASDSEVEQRGCDFNNCFTSYVSIWHWMAPKCHGSYWCSSKILASKNLKYGVARKLRVCFYYKFIRLVVQQKDMGKNRYKYPEERKKCFKSSTKQVIFHTMASIISRDLCDTKQ